MIKRGPDWYFITLILLACSIPLSEFGMSVSQILLLLVWMFYDRPQHEKGRGFAYSVLVNIRQRFSRFLRNPAALIASSIYLLHIAGLLHTSDFSYALKDLRVKLPLLILPLVLGSMPRLSERKTNTLLLFFIAAVFAGSLFSFFAYMRGNFTDIREISLFISPVRFSLTMVLSIVLLIVLMLRNPQLHWFFYVLGTGLSVWFFYMITLLESATGFFGLMVLLTLLTFHLILRIRKAWLRWSLIILAVTIPMATIFFVVDAARDVTARSAIDLENLDPLTSRGYPYRHDTIHFGLEDGRYIGLYLAEAELADAWNRRSSYEFYGTDDAGQLIMYTIIRYMTSKDLRKDADGVSALSEQDIRNIEKGIANASYLQPGLRTRISKVFIGYQNLKFFGDPNRSSDFQRIEYLKASWHILKSNFIVGVGTGDVASAFRQAYDEIDSPLQQKFRWRAHNQFISIAIAFGFAGLAWFLFALFYPAIKQRRFSDLIYLLFFVLMLMSMLTEDTLESQPGVTLFAFFNAFLLFTADRTRHNSPNMPL
ncbi:MAG TPA: O-antigen ligase family protein [Bacteroidales bacterium]|nr:O-antigen ligase family protein [Bacteroidales bacterium]